MFAALLTWLIQSHGAKTAGAAATISLGGVLTLVFTMHSGLSSRIDSQKDKIHQVEVMVAPIDAKLAGLKTSIDNNNSMVRDIYKYLLNKNPRLKED